METELIKKDILELAPWELVIYKLIGTNLVDARRIAKENGFCVRVVREDEERYIVTCDVDAERINVAIDNGIITAADLG